jgi:eukaryotic-like serine/threonine-protein kinase
MPELWEQVKEILALALERPQEERSVFVRRACGGNAELRAEVESLLLSSNEADSLLENPPAANLPSLSGPGKPPEKTIGAYRIVREIGQGGMAVVYLGERDDQNYRKRVAIKMVKPGIGTEHVLQRFRNERQTLAALDHPNIVKLLDGGSTEDGLPYLVMEYVEGQPIDQYSDSCKLSIHARLQLFREVCAAVQYAHQNLVIHRDLKPGNILITSDGLPRLLDFGIAKLLNPEFQQARLVTVTDVRPMTPEYASPEQVRGDPVTSASDIYSLGVLLYEILTGSRPYRIADNSWRDIERLVCEVEPLRPSTMLTTDQGRDAHSGPKATREFAARRPGLHHDEGARKGSAAPLRDRVGTVG